MKTALAAALLATMIFGAPGSAAAKKPKRPRPPAADPVPPPVEEPPPAEAAPPAEAPPADPVDDAPRVEKKEPPAEPPDHVAGDWRDPTEEPNTKMLFLGIRYRGTIIPRFVIGLFADEGRTVFSNSFGLEIDMRHDGYSIIPSFSYTDYGMQDTLFLQKGKDAGNPANWSFINSNLKAIYLGVDILWSAHLNRNVDLEYGLGVGAVRLGGRRNGRGVFSRSHGRGEQRCAYQRRRQQ